MPTIESLLKDIEIKWEDVATRTVANTVTAHPGDTFYGAGFWSFYADYTIIGAPCFAMNTEAHLAADPYSDSNRWIPPNWKFANILGADHELVPLYQQVSEALSADDEDRWQQVIEEHKQLIARVCRRVTAAIHARRGAFAVVTLPASFVVGIFEEQDGDDEYDRLARLSIDESLIDSIELPQSGNDPERIKALLARFREEAE